MGWIHSSPDLLINSRKREWWKGGGGGGKQCAMASDGILQRETYNEEDDENRSR